MSESGKGKCSQRHDYVPESAPPALRLGRICRLLSVSVRAGGRAGPWTLWRFGGAASGCLGGSAEQQVGQRDARRRRHHPHVLVPPLAPEPCQSSVQDGAKRSEIRGERVGAPVVGGEAEGVVGEADERGGGDEDGGQRGVRVEGVGQRGEDRGGDEGAQDADCEGGKG